MSERGCLLAATGFVCVQQMRDALQAIDVAAAPFCRMELHRAGATKASLAEKRLDGDWHVCSLERYHSQRQQLSRARGNEVNLHKKNGLVNGLVNNAKKL